MNLAELLIPLNQAPKNILLGVILGASTAVSREQARDHFSRLVTDGGWIPGVDDISHHMTSFYDLGIIRREDGTGSEDSHDRFSKIGEYTLTDRVWADLALFMLEFEIKNKKSWFNILGNCRINGGRVISPLENRIKIIESLYSGKKTILEISNETGIRPYQVTKNLEVLANAEILSVPDNSTLDSNTYSIPDKKKFEKYFEEKLPDAVQGALSYCYRRKDFKVDDLVADGTSRSKGYLLRMLGRMEKAGVITSRFDKKTKVYSLSEEYLTDSGVKRKELLESLVITFLPMSDKTMFWLYQEKMKGSSKPWRFRTNDIREYMEDLKIEAMRRKLNALVSGGYLHMDVSCVKDKFYSLTPLGYRAWEHLLEAQRFFEDRQESRVTKYISVFSGDNTLEGKSAGVTEAMQLYRPHCSFNKRRSPEHYRFMVAQAVNHVAMTKDGILKSMGISPSGTVQLRKVFKQMIEDGSISCDTGKFEYTYSLTPEGRKKYLS
ncbi:MAG TPA: ArsR family transcriptional regulator [Candidatus Nanoarchaeia archaeon]|nr:ArsR family transcriptional regulator [Candidatus Nanoarchaeia archaeon]